MFGADDLHLHWAPWCGRMLMVPNSNSKSKIGRPVFDKNDSFEQSCNRLSSKGWIGKVKKVWSVYLIYPLHTSDVIIWMLTYYKGDISQLNQQLTATKSLQSPLLNAMKLLTHIFFLVWFKCTCCNINTILITSLCLKIQILSVSICNGIVISLCIELGLPLAGGEPTTGMPAFWAAAVTAAAKSVSAQNDPSELQLEALLRLLPPVLLPFIDAHDAIIDPRCNQTQQTSYQLDFFH